MSDRLWIQLMVLIGLSCMGLGGLLLPEIDRQRVELQITISPDPHKNLPVEVAIAQAGLGSARAFAINFLWIRAQKLQDNGQYYEAMQLGDWITKLQRNVPDAWAFQSWNMAFNLSRSVRTNPERWMWVNAGIHILRDEGVLLNPNAPKLYQQLAHIYFYKIGKISVEEHWYLKAALAAEWQDIMGIPPEGPAWMAVDAFRPIVLAPRTLEELRNREPATYETLQLLKSWGYEADRKLVAEISRWETRKLWNDVVSREEKPPVTNQEKLWAWMDDPKNETARVKVAAFARSQVIRKNYNMDLGLMNEMLETYGPIDWRHPMAHSAYWGLLGARIIHGRLAKDSFDVVQMDRYVLQGLQHLSFSGRVYFDPDTGYYDQAPDPRMFHAYEIALFEAGRRRGVGDNTPYELKDAHRGFLERAVEYSYLLGDTEIAKEYYIKLRKQYGPEHPGDYEMALRDFVRGKVVKGLDQWDKVTSNLNSLIKQALLYGLLYKREDTERRSLAMAKYVYDQFKQKKLKVGYTDRQMNEMPPFEDMVADAFGRFMLTAPNALNPILKIRAWQRAPMWLKQRAFPRIKGPLYQEAARLKLDPEKSYPEPPSSGAAVLAKPDFSDADEIRGETETK